MRVLVLSDTHSPGRWKGIPDALLPELDRADVILHAGDVCTPDVLDALARHAPVHVVLGNNDGAAIRAWGASPTLELELAGVRIAMIHDSGPKHGRVRRMARLFPTADLVVYGHSHIPADVPPEPPQGGPHLFNPGSPTDRRTQPTGTYGILDLHDGRIVRTAVIAI